MIEIVGQRRVNVGQLKIVLGSDLVGALAHALVPDHDVLHGDSAASNPRLAARNSGCDLDVVVQHLGHGLSIATLSSTREITAAHYHRTAKKRSGRFHIVGFYWRGEGKGVCATLADG